MYLTGLGFEPFQLVSVLASASRLCHAFGSGTISLALTPTLTRAVRDRKSGRLANLVFLLKIKRASYTHVTGR